MAKKLSTAMQTALMIAYQNGQVRKGDAQRQAELGLAGQVATGTLVALLDAKLLTWANDPSAAVYELTREGLRVLGHAGLISADEFYAMRVKWNEWMDAAHAEALDMMAQAEAEAGYERYVLGTQIDPAPQAEQRWSRRLAHGPEIVRVEGVRSGSVRYRFVRAGHLSAPYSLRVDRFVERYSPATS